MEKRFSEVMKKNEGFAKKIMTSAKNLNLELTDYDQFLNTPSKSQQGYMDSSL